MNSTDKLVDPDPFTIIASVSAAVSAICAVVTVVRLKPEPDAPLLSVKQPFWSEQFLKEIDELSRATKRLIRWLSTGPGVDFDPLGRPFEFGQTALFLSPGDHTYHELSQSIPQRLANLMDLGISLHRHDPVFATALGHRVLKEIHDIEKRVNDLFRGHHTNGEVLDHCLELLRTIERVAGELTASRGQN